MELMDISRIAESVTNMEVGYVLVGGESRRRLLVDMSVLQNLRGGGCPVDQTFFWGVNIRSSGEAKCLPVSRSYPGVFYFTLGIFNIASRWLIVIL